jgi:hypothetical protein
VTIDKDSVGVDDLFTDSRKIDIFMYANEYYTHKQVELKNNLLFMRMKKRYMKHIQE